MGQVTKNILKFFFKKYHIFSLHDHKANDINPIEKLTFRQVPSGMAQQHFINNSVFEVAGSIALKTISN